MYSINAIMNNAFRKMKENTFSASDWIIDRFREALKSFFEVFFTVIFTFVPIIILSIRWSQMEGANTFSSFFENFLGFWQSGQIVLPILGLCGAVAASLALNKGYFAWWIHAIVWAIILLVAIAGGAALSSSNAFSEELNQEVIYFSFMGYGALALLWFLLSVIIRTTEVEPRGSDRSARSILNEANDIRSASRGKK